MRDWSEALQKIIKFWIFLGVSTKFVRSEYQSDKEDQKFKKKFINSKIEYIFLNNIYHSLFSNTIKEWYRYWSMECT